MSNETKQIEWKYEISVLQSRYTWISMELYQIISARDHIDVEMATALQLSFGEHPKLNSVLRFGERVASGP